MTEDKLFELTRDMANTNWKSLQPEKLSIDPNSPTAEDEWKLWLKTFTNFIEAMTAGEGEAQINKLIVLTAYLTASIYKVIVEIKVQGSELRP